MRHCLRFRIHQWRRALRHISLALICLTLLAPLRAQETDDLIHSVAAGETLISIANDYGVTLDQLLTLNKLDPDGYLQIGQLLLVIPDALQADGEEADEQGAEDEVDSDEATPRAIAAAGHASAPVVEASAPMTDPANLSPQICFIIYADDNQNGMREPNETKLSAGQIILLDDVGIEQLHYTTDGEAEPYCVRDLGRRMYRLEALPPDGYGISGATSLWLDLRAGGQLQLDFGARPGLARAPVPDLAVDIESAPSDESTGLLREMSGLIVLALAGLVFVSGTVVSLFLRGR